MTDGLPDIEIEPKSILQLAIPSDPTYTIESPSEIREKLTELANDYGGSLGEESDESGLLTLTGLELHTRPEVSPEPFELLIHPKLIAFVKSVHPTFWADQLRQAAQANEEWRQIEQGEEGAVLATGIPGPVRDVLSGLGVRIAGGGAENKMTIDEFNNGGAERECCCSHMAKDHAIGERIMGECTKCDCGHFHTH